MALADDGSFAVCHMGFGTVWLFNRLGEPQLRIRSRAGLLTSNCAYGGPDRRTLFIAEAESASILSVELPVAGMPLFGGQALSSSASPCGACPENDIGNIHPFKSYPPFC